MPALASKGNYVRKHKWDIYKKPFASLEKYSSSILSIY